MTGTGIAASLTTLVTLGIEQPIRFGLQKRVQRLLHRATDHTVQVTFDPLVINRDDIAQRTRCILCHGVSLSLSWLLLATSSSARFGAASPTQLCERFTTSSRDAARPRAYLRRPAFTGLHESFPGNPIPIPAPLLVAGGAPSITLTSWFSVGTSAC